MKIYYNKQGKRRNCNDTTSEIDENLNTTVINSEVDETLDCSRVFYKDFSLGDFENKVQLESIRTAIGSFAESNITSFHIPFYNLNNGTELFYNCVNLKSYTPSEMKLEQGSKMFYNCNAIDNFEWSNRDYLLKDGSYMFAYSSLKKYNPALEDYFIPQITNAKGMFEGCTQLEEANIGLRMDITDSFDGSYMFKNCSNLKKFTGSLTVEGQVLTRMFEGCNKLEDLTLELKNYHRDTTEVENGVTKPVHYSAMQRFSNLFGENYFTNEGTERTSVKKMSLDVVCEEGDEKYMKKIFQGATGFSNLTDVNLNVSGYFSQTNDDYAFSALTNGDGMFEGCSNLQHVNGSMQLTSAYNMFKGCNLSVDALNNIKDNLLGSGHQEKIFKEGTSGQYSFSYLNQLTLGCNKNVKNEIEKIANEMAENDWIVASNVKPTGKEDWYFSYLKLLGTNAGNAYNANYRIEIYVPLSVLLPNRFDKYTLYCRFINDNEYYASPKEYELSFNGYSEYKSCTLSINLIEGGKKISEAEAFNKIFRDKAIYALKKFKGSDIVGRIKKIKVFKLKDGVNQEVEYLVYYN